ncbi:MAG: NAD(P)/FAD-dependent oxidoreductase [Candidatus Pacebacteria bacterium]|nr:NAD(P)/FAD-dependent oxidoreductase [Candidatus Paceibacterota bacterium]
MPNKFDIIVIGAGAGGLNIASFMNSLGLRVLLIDKSEERIGGDCLNYGCVPSKALIHVARLFRAGREAVAFGAAPAGNANLRTVKAHIKRAQGTIREHESAAYFREKGMTVVIGVASFVDPKTIRVSNQTYTAKRIIIATGSRPRELLIPGVERVKEQGRYHTNETIFDLDVLPKHLLIIGGGPIGVELGQAFGHLGSRVTIVTPENHLLPREDEKVSSIIEKTLREEGVDIRTNETVVRFEEGNQLVTTHNHSGSESTIAFDAVLIAIGRVLNTEGLQLQSARIQQDDKGRLVLNTQLQTTNPRVFACGDIAGQHQFTHAAELHAGVILRNFFKPLFKSRLNTDYLGAVTYTSPEVATFGLSPNELTKRGIAFAVLEDNFGHDDRALTSGGKPAYTKLCVTKKGKILGGTMIAEGAGELVQELMLAQSTGLTTKVFFAKNYPYPTATRINKKLVTDQARGRLTTNIKTVLRNLYRLW